MFGVVQKNSVSAKKTNLESESCQIEEGGLYEIGAFIPNKIQMTSELVRRQREEELRKNYCKKNDKKADL